MSNTLFLADTHFGHNRISDKFRTEFSSDEEHNAIIHDNILSSGGKRDTLWLLGDIIFSDSELWRVEKYTEAFRQVNIVLGNHDTIALPYYASKRGARVFGLTKKYKAWISHCPVHPDEMYRAMVNIHGHLHTSRVQEPVDPEEGAFVDDDRYICVSCEQVDYKPIFLDTIRSIANL